MTARDQADWMFSEALDTLARAERMHRHFFHLQRSPTAREPAWEPPIDVLETEREVLIFIALPGVDPGSGQRVIEDGTLVVSGRCVSCPLSCVPP